MNAQDWNTLCDIIHANSSLEQELLALEDPARFIERTQACAMKAGYTVTLAEIIARIQQSKQVRIEMNQAK